MRKLKQSLLLEGLGFSKLAITDVCLRSSHWLLSLFALATVICRVTVLGPLSQGQVVDTGGRRGGAIAAKSLLPGPGIKCLGVGGRP